jgi:hypothetical protein
MKTENNNLEWALFWASQNWKLFPSYWESRGNKSTHLPRTRWRQPGGVSSDPIVLSHWAFKWPGCYFCVDVQQSGLTLLDIDSKHGKNGPGELKHLEFVHGTLPATLIVSTPSGGSHYWFNGLSTHTLGKLGPGIDTPSMAPVPGTTIPSKGTYIPL